MPPLHKETPVVQMKQFSGATVDEVLLKVRAELGEDAVILQTKRVVNGGIGGFFGRQGVEVTAAEGLPDADEANLEAAASVAIPAEPETESDEDTNPFRRHLEGRLAAAEEAEGLDAPVPPGAPASPAATYARTAGAAPPPPRPFAAGDLERSHAILEAARAAVRQAHESAALAAPPAPAPLPVPDDDLIDDDPAIDAPFVPAAFHAEPVPAPPPAPSPVRAPARQAAASLDGIRNELVRGGVDERLLERFLEGFGQSVAPFLDAGDSARDAVRDYISSRLPIARDWKAHPSGQTLAFVGQSGVGKTSAAACLAGRYRAAGLAVALVAAGAGPHDSLEGHARRLDVQLFRAADGPALATLCGTLADRDLVVIDTAGRSQQQLGEIEELAALLAPARPAEVHLVLPATASLADIGDVQRRFRMVGVNRIALTKLDETRFHGNLLNLPMRVGKPLSYLSAGTSVPRALAPADGRRVAEMLLP